MNLLAIELLYLSFATALHQHPNFISAAAIQTTTTTKCFEGLELDGGTRLPSLKSLFQRTQSPPSTETMVSCDPVYSTQIFQKLTQLQSWKEPLRNLPDQALQHIWKEVSRYSERFTPQYFVDISSLVNYCAQDILSNMSAIEYLHSLVAPYVQRSPPLDSSSLRHPHGKDSAPPVHSVYSPSYLSFTMHKPSLSKRPPVEDNVGPQQKRVRYFP